ncbi:MAG: flagellar biosynthesis protein FlhF [Bacillota bacterium]
MRVKRFVAETLQDAMNRVKMDMGKEAVILHTRKFKEGGFLGFFGRQMFEVMAALEDNYPVPEPEPKTAAPVRLKSLSRVAAAIQESPEDNDDLVDEIQEMKTMMEEMMTQIEQQREGKNYPAEVQKIFQQLLDREVEEKLAHRLIKDMLKQSPDDCNGGEAACEALEKSILKLLKKPRPITFKKKDGQQQSIVLVGPTGVGKTTTIAKLAATFAIVDKKKVALITADTYRVAAVEQLKTYGEIIGIPVEVIYTAQELKKATERHQDKDLILIDTAGRSHRNTVQMAELKTLMDAVQPTVTYLVLSATTKYKDMLEIVESYADINVNALVFTKLDETSCFGAVLNIVNKTQKHLSYVTVGQNVPDDIEIADPVKIARMIARER